MWLKKSKTVLTHSLHPLLFLSFFLFLRPLSTFLFFFVSHWLSLWAMRTHPWSNCLQPVSVNFPGEMPRASKSFKTAELPILKYATASYRPISRNSCPTYTSLGTHYCHIISFSTSFWFCVFPCKHFSNKLSSLSLAYSGWSFAISSKRSPGSCL